MTNGSEGPRGPIDHTRQVTIDALCEHFAKDVISVEEFERRVDLAHSAASNDELRRLLQDLPEDNLPATRDDRSPAVRQPHPSVARHEREHSYQVAVLGGTRRSGRWAPARVNRTMAIMGGVELDFREASLPAGVTEVNVYTVMGGVEIIVPPGLNVESEGIGLLGGFEHVADNNRPDPTAPTLRVSGISVMGGVEITVRHPGETAREARRRRRQERRSKRKRLRSGSEDLMDDLLD